MASWYGKRYAGRPTASGERFDPRALTAAHPTLPLGSQAEVRRWTDGRRVVVRINDRGPARGDGIDLSEAAARALGLLAEGTGLVVVTPLPQQQLAAGR
ncbi:MAG: septal ring lytic transglycosylase RlpA family protein [Magnetospirillum sp.]|nr:septal ring lytic transglycosylase RlpA family protein [Magnetospirillum sp.]